MILNDAIYFINAGRDQTPFTEIIVQSYDFVVSLDGRKMVDLVEEDVHETKKLLENEIIELSASMGEEGDEDYNHEWAALHENLSLLIDRIDGEVENINVESVTYGESLMYIIIKN